MGKMILQSKKQYAIRGIPKNPAIRLSRTYRIIFSLRVATILSFGFLWSGEHGILEASNQNLTPPLPKKQI